MAKALYGHFGGPDAQIVAELHRLRRQVQDLECEVERLRAAQDHNDLVLLTDEHLAELSPALF